MKKQWWLRVAVVLGGAACMAPGCNGDVLSDPNFHIWCGESLCSWKTDVGSVRRVPTWHPNDFGVELVDAPTQISQETTEGSECMVFSAVADVDARAQVKVQVDFTLDGTPDFEVPIAETHWRPAKTIIHAPPGHGTTFRFILRKEGEGHAALAEMRLQRADASECSAPAIDLHDLAVGDRCATNAECKGGLCDTVKVRAEDGGSNELPGTCGACASNTTCGNGTRCRKPDRTELALTAAFFFDPRPNLCGPGEVKGATGESCVAPSDCASGACDDVLLHANPACDGGVRTDGIGLVGTGCEPIGVRAGRCR